MKLGKVVNKDGALLWLKEKIDEGWTAAQIRGMTTLTTGVPAECRALLRKLLDKMEELEFESWTHKREIRCEECGYHRIMTIKLLSQNGRGVWVPGMKCPKCSSGKFYPVVEIGVVREPLFRKYWKGNPVVGFGLILVLFVSLFVTIRPVYTRALERKPEKVVFLCQEDGEFFASPISFYPIKCPNCGKRKALMAIKCEKCGHIYVWQKINWINQPPVCPKCGSKKSALLSKIPE